MDTEKRLEQLRQEHAVESLRAQTLMELDCVQLYARTLEKLRRIEADHEFVKGLDDAKQNVPEVPETIHNGDATTSAPLRKMLPRKREAAATEN